MAYTFKYGDRPLEGVTIQRAVGRGGFGEVYYAVSDSGKQLALKYLRENPEVELRGIGHVMNLKSPHLITIYDVKKDQDGAPWVMMEYVSGPSLRDILNNEPQGLGPAKAAFFLNGITQGLSYLHDRGIVHRDLKPGNIFYDDGYVKIGDYGLSKHISMSQHSGNTISVGTVHYMAPEIGSGNYSKAIDIYALGVMLYEMLTGRLPFAGSSMGEILMRHLNERPDLSAVQEPFRGVIAKALAKEPSQRFQDVNEMVDILKAATEVASGMSSFDPRTLTSVPRNLNVASAERTLTSGPAVLPPLPALDVREGLPGLESLPPSLRKKAERLHRKLDRKAQRLERKYGRTGSGRRQAISRERAARLQATGARVAPTVLTTGTVAIALSFAAAWASPMRGDSAAALGVAFGLFLFGGTLGTLLTHFKLLRSDGGDPSFIDRLAYAAVAGLFMLVGLIPASEAGNGDATALILAPLAVLTLCNWSQRIEEGRARNIEGRAMFWPAVIGFIAAHIADIDELRWVAAGLCGSLSLVTQAAASLWPRTATGGGGAGWSPVMADGPRPFNVVPPPPPPMPAPVAVSPAAMAGEAAAAAAAAAPAHHRVPATDDSAAPATESSLPAAKFVPGESWVSRWFSGLIGLAGFLLVLGGLVHAGVYHMPPVTVGEGAAQVEVSPRGVRVEQTGMKVYVPVPRAVVVATVAGGCLLLLVARRQFGAGAFLRTAVGASAAVGAALYLVNRTGLVAHRLLEGVSWHEFSRAQHADLIVMLILLFMSGMLLLWPVPRSVAVQR